MGLDREWQAIPDDWEAFHLAKVGGRFSGHLEFIVLYYERGCLPLHESDEEDIAFCHELKTLMLNHPGIDNRNYRPAGRNHDAVHFLLSQSRRNGELYAEDLGSNTIRGATALPVDPSYLRYSKPADVTQIAAFLAPITETDLRRHYYPVEMEAEAVYKFWVDRLDETTWNNIWEDFQGIRAVYLAADEHGEGVLATIG